jgi:hypothetical protein
MEVRAAPFSLSFFSIPRQNKQNVCQDRLRTKQNGRKAHAKMGFFCVSKRTQREQKASVLPQWHYSAQSFCEPNLPTHSKSGAKVDYLLRSILVQQPVRFKLGGRPVLSAHLNVETAGSEPKRAEI